MTILGNSLKRIFGKRRNILFMIVVPVVLNLFVISAATKDVRYDIGILDNDSSRFTRDFISYLQKTCNVVLLNGKDDIRGMVINKKVDCAFVFKAGFTDEMISGKEIHVESYALENTNGAKPVQIYAGSYISAARGIAAAAKGNAEKFYRGMEDYQKSEYAAEYKNISKDGENVGKAVSSLGFIAFGMVFFLGFSSTLILEDKLSGVYDRVSVTPLKRSSYFIQYMISYLIVAVIQIELLIDNMPQIVNISFGTDTQKGEIMLLCGIFAAVCISIGVLISRYSRNLLMAGALTTLVNIPMLMLGGCFWPREIMPEFIRKIGDLMPTTWFLKAGEAILYGNGMMSVINEILSMLALASVLMVISFAFRSEKAR